MHRLFIFLYRYRALLLFVFLEVICGWLIIRNNNYQGAAFFNTSSYMVGQTLKNISDVKSYFNLKQVKEELAAENAMLRQQLNVAIRKQTPYIDERSAEFPRVHQFKYYPAKVVNNSTARFYNYITIDKGSADGIKPGMGVISSNGVVGKVKSCSEHFSTVISLLHAKWSVSAKINGNIDGSIQWNKADPLTADLLYVGRHHNLSIGDTVVTSGYTAVFPEGIMIGRVKQFSIDQGKPFYKVDVNLSSDFTSLNYVYVIDNLLRQERDSLERASNYGAEE